MKNKKLKGLVVVLLASSTQCFGQLPSNYVTKVSYVEQKDVSYSLPSEATMNCLTLSELAMYHGFMQLYTMDEYIDVDGDLLTDQNFLDEINVRDEWMEGYSRITVGKNTVDIYGMESGLMLQKPRMFDSNDLFLNHQQSLDYGFLNLNQDYVNQLVTYLEAEGLSVSQSNNIVTGSNSLVTIAYDHNNKMLSATDYDSLGVKCKESVIEYALSTSGETYYPKTETIFEWFLSKNGCCIRKVTVIARNEHNREVFDSETSNGSEKKSLVQQVDKQAASDIQILTENASDAFRIDSETFRDQNLHVVIYDMAGKKVLETTAIEGESIEVPQSSRAGMFLIHVLVEGSSTPIVGKIIKSNAGTKF